MSLTPEQIAEGWIEWSGGPCPIKNDDTVFDIMLRDHDLHHGEDCRANWGWYHQGGIDDIIGYRLVKARGADAEPARPTPFPASYDDLVFDADGWSQTIIVDGKRPEWLRDDDSCAFYIDARAGWEGCLFTGNETSIRVRRREPKRETVKGYIVQWGGFAETPVTYDLIDGKPDLSTLKMEGEA